MNEVHCVFQQITSGCQPKLVEVWDDEDAAITSKDGLSLEHKGYHFSVRTIPLFSAAHPQESEDGQKTPTNSAMDAIAAYTKEYREICTPLTSKMMLRSKGFCEKYYSIFMRLLHHGAKRCAARNQGITADRGT